MNTIGFFGVLAGSAVALAFFLSSYFLLIKGKEDARNLWLGLILLAIGLRVGKSIIYFLANGIAPIGLALGFFGLASIGPLLWYLIIDVKTLKIRNFWHFLIPMSGAITCYIVTPSRWETLIYIGATVVLMLYLIASWIHNLQAKGEIRWNRKVLIMASGVWMAFVYQHVSNSMMDYAFGAIIAAIFLYWIFFQSFKSEAFTKGLSITLPDHTLNQVKEAFEGQMLFRESGITLQSFSAKLKIPSYLVTRSVKELYNRSFPEALNHFRIEEVKQMLLDPSKEHLKIESLAYEVGFASPSAFYSSFKKVTGQTPTSYQKEATLMSA